MNAAAGAVPAPETARNKRARQRSESADAPNAKAVAAAGAAGNVGLLRGKSDAAAPAGNTKHGSDPLRDRPALQIRVPGADVDAHKQSHTAPATAVGEATDPVAALARQVQELTERMQRQEEAQKQLQDENAYLRSRLPDAQDAPGSRPSSAPSPRDAALRDRSQFDRTIERQWAVNQIRKLQDHVTKQMDALRKEVHRVRGEMRCGFQYLEGVACAVEHHCSMVSSLVAFEGGEEPFASANAQHADRSGVASGTAVCRFAEGHGRDDAKPTVGLDVASAAELASLSARFDALAGDVRANADALQAAPFEKLSSRLNALEASVQGQADTLEAADLERLSRCTDAMDAMDAIHKVAAAHADRLQAVEQRATDTESACTKLDGELAARFDTLQGKLTQQASESAAALAKRDQLLRDLRAKFEEQRTELGAAQERQAAKHEEHCSSLAGEVQAVRGDLQVVRGNVQAWRTEASTKLQAIDASMEQLAKEQQASAGKVEDAVKEIVPQLFAVDGIAGLQGLVNSVKRLTIFVDAVCNVVKGSLALQYATKYRNIAKSCLHLIKQFQIVHSTDAAAASDESATQQAAADIAHLTEQLLKLVQKLPQPGSATGEAAGAGGQGTIAAASSGRGAARRGQQAQQEAIDLT